jgi:hypothetical protein
MDKVVLRGSMGGIGVYIIVGFFGYVTFADQPYE